MHEEGTDFCGFRRRIEQAVVASGAMIAAAQGFAAGPASAGYKWRSGTGVKGFHDEIGPVGDELGVNAEVASEGSVELRGRVILRLKLAYRAVDEGVQTRDVGGRSEAVVEGVGPVILKSAPCSRW